MANERSDKCCFQSKFGGGWITAGQFLAEIMCERDAISSNQKLFLKFWNDPYWLKKFKLQLKHANELLETYPVEAILAALKHKDLKKVYSLGLKSAIIPIAERERDKIERSKLAGNICSVEEEEKVIDITQKPRQTFSPGANKLNKLRELE
jgi:hypothetical protein